jgi:hypothetical protein
MVVVDLAFGRASELIGASLLEAGSVGLAWGAQTKNNRRSFDSLRSLRMTGFFFWRDEQFG